MSSPRHSTAASAPPALAPVVRLQRPTPPSGVAILDYYRMSEEAGFFANGGPCAQLLAQRLEDYVGGGAFCVPVGNCTVGLMAALRGACGAPSPGRRLIITPSFTFTATACAIEWSGFEPVFADIDGSTWHLSADALEATLDRLGDRVAGVMACAAFGTAPPLEQRAAWRALCERHGVPLLIDSAPGFGAQDEQGGRLGGAGDLEVFSFHATKPFAIGEGGMVATPDPQLAARMARLVNFGLEPGTRVSQEAGLNGKMSELHAATGLAMLDRFGDDLERRRALARRMRRELEGHGVTYQDNAEGSTWQFFQITLPDAPARERAVRAAAALGVEVRTLHEPALHHHPAFSHCLRGDLEATDRVAARSLSLPMASRLSDFEVDRIVEVVRRAAA